MKKMNQLVLKTIMNCLVVYKASLPVGTKRQRKDGTYQKQPDGKWKKIVEEKKSKENKNIQQIKIIKNPEDLLPSKKELESSKATINTKNFNNWFGDWKNDIQNSSKVINQDGSPKIVYHGSGYNITDFSSDSQRGFGKAYFTEKNETAIKYAVGGGITNKTVSEYIEKYNEMKKKGKLKKRNPTVKAVFLNIKKPLTEKSANIKSILGEDKDSIIRLLSQNDEYNAEYLEEVIDNDTEFFNRANEILKGEGEENPYVGEDTEAFSSSPMINGLLSFALTDPDYVENLKKYYDGVIYNDNETGSKSYIIFNANQAKDINSTMFSNSDDLSK